MVNKIHATIKKVALVIKWTIKAFGNYCTQKVNTSAQSPSHWLVKAKVCLNNLLFLFPARFFILWPAQSRVSPTWERDTPPAMKITWALQPERERLMYPGHPAAAFTACPHLHTELLSRGMHCVLPLETKESYFRHIPWEHRSVYLSIHPFMSQDARGHNVINTTSESWKLISIMKLHFSLHQVKTWI